jgi:acetolactate synthase-1/2/3 large subunit
MAANDGGAPTTTAAHVLLARLCAPDDGVHICFANPGTTEMGLVAAMDALPPGRLRPVLCLQEGVCAGAADGYARCARRPAAALLHLGPGLANALSALHNARRARSPLLCIIGDMVGYLEHEEGLIPALQNSSLESSPKALEQPN